MFSAAVAGETDKKPASGMTEWLKGLQKKIGQIVPKKTVPVTTSVAGVRGAKEDTQVKLYWKGKKSEELVTEQEMAEFKNGVDLAANGDTEASVKKIEEFMKQYPDSAMIPDAKKTLDLVKAEIKPEAKADLIKKEQEEKKEEPKDKDVKK